MYVIPETFQICINKQTRLVTESGKTSYSNYRWKGVTKQTKTNRIMLV